MMPEMTGMELFEHLSELVPEQAAQMVFLSGGTFSQSARGFLETTKHLLIEKPFDTQALQSLVNTRVKAREDSAASGTSS
jgi:response regulator RpfG family c-di-GMP phosphodiesterase